jgi:hypothetical protein
MTIALSKFLGPIPLDVVVREVHESDLFITANPVEFGANVADHAIIEPKRLVMDAIAGSRPGTPAAVAGAYQALVRLQESRQPFSVVTALNRYRNMLVERLSVDRDKTFGRVLYFRAELREVIIVDTETASGQAVSGQAARRRGAGSRLTHDAARKQRDEACPHVHKPTGGRRRPARFRQRHGGVEL